MKIDVYSNMHNEENLLPYWLRHYETIADRIFVWDDDSTDATRKILDKHPKVTVLPVKKHHPDEAYWVTFVFPQYELFSRGVADWVMVADADEFIYHPNLRQVLEQEKTKGTQLIKCHGYSMVSESFPTAHGQIYDEIKMGISDKMEGKWTIHSPEIMVRYGKGRHGPIDGHRAYTCNRYAKIKLLHYRYLGDEYLESRNKKLFERHRFSDKITGEYSDQEKHTCPDGSRAPLLSWFNAHKGEAVNVI